MSLTLTLRLVQLNGPRDQGEWQFQTLDGESADVGLFITREFALIWAREHRWQVVESDVDIVNPHSPVEPARRLR
jgi:hypothetical protein